MRAPPESIALAFCALLVTGAARHSPAPVSDALRSVAQRAERNLVGAGEEMPAEKYGFKPTPAQMSFGEVIAHLTEGNDFLCSKIGGVAPPKRAKLTASAAKPELLEHLKESFRFCDSALAKVTDSQLDAKVPFFEGGQVSRAAAMFAATEDWADHYSQLAIYLRLNGLLPPTAKNRTG